MAETLTLSTTFVVHTCIRSGCSCVWATTSEFDRLRRNDHENFYCPWGHAQHYPHKSVEEKLRADLEAKNNELARERARLDQVKAALEHEKHSARATRGHLTRVKTRVRHGVCPCCNRSFGDLKRHMDTQHPDYAAEAS